MRELLAKIVAGSSYRPPSILGPRTLELIRQGKAGRLPEPMPSPATPTQPTRGLKAGSEQILHDLFTKLLGTKHITVRGLGDTRPLTHTPTPSPMPTATTMPSPTLTPTPTLTPIPTMAGPTPSPRNRDTDTTLADLRAIFSHVNRPDAPVAKVASDLLDVEKNRDLPGLARVLSALAQIESNLGESSQYDPSTHNPFGILQAGHGSDPMTFGSVKDAADYLGGLFQDPNFVYKVPSSTPLTIPAVEQYIAPHYNLEGNRFATGQTYWDLFKELYNAGY